MTPDPQQTIKIYSRGNDRRQIEAIEGVDDGSDLTAPSGRRHHLQKQRGAP
jgi:hypothetical protein